MSRTEYLKAEHRPLFVIGMARRHKRRVNTEGLRMEWQTVDMLKSRSDKPIRAAMKSVFINMEREVLANLRKLPGLKGLVPTSGLGAAILTPWMQKETDLMEAVLDIPRWEQILTGDLGPRVLAAMEDGFDAGFARVGVAGPDFSSQNPLVRTAMRHILLKGKGVVGTVAEYLSTSLQEGLTAGETRDEMAARVRGVFHGMKDWKALQIAQTAGTAGFETGQQVAFDEAGVEKERWLSERDASVRESHASLDGEEVEIGREFSNGLLHPGDPSGDPEEVINCRCTVLPLLQ